MEALFIAIGSYAFITVMYLLHVTVSARLCGWRELASRFQTSARPSGRIRWRDVLLVGVLWNGFSIGMAADPAGLYLWPSILVRPLLPTLLVPWSEVRHGLRTRLLWKPFYGMDLGGIGSIHITERGFAAVKRFIGR